MGVARRDGVARRGTLALALVASAAGCGAKTGLDTEPAVDLCGDGWDGDADGLVDEDCPCEAGFTQVCYSGPPETTDVGACRSGVQACDPTSGTLGACEGEVLPAREDCDNGVDDDCDGAADCRDAECRRGEHCEASFVRTEICDGLDNDGDGRADEGQACPQGDGPCPVAGAIRICDSYCGVHQRCRADGTWGPCIIDGSGPATVCSVHADCERGEWCDVGNCISARPCFADGDCGGSGWCAAEQGTCVDECFHHDDCDPPTVCDLGRCVDDPYYPSL